ncbi:SixA phosphatase family protein [Caulobacter sp. ErkDOM-E]|uniref:SixA phosphatase family protein n=1 Tax=Caulobacter sp. ErkDOM-E TaxID=3402778 RepID=UPI003AF88FDD
MDRLILMRHGQAERQAATGGDFERGLTPKGREDATLMGQLLARSGATPDLVLVSSARRTRETFAAVSAAFPKARVEFRRDLYHAEPEEVVTALEDEGEAASLVMVIGHNPGLHELALRLILQGGAEPVALNKVRGRFPTATTAVFAFGSGGPPVLEHLFYASEHGGTGGE